MEQLEYSSYFPEITYVFCGFKYWSTFVWPSQYDVREQGTRDWNVLDDYGHAF